MRLVVGLSLAVVLFATALVVGFQTLAPILGIGKIRDFAGPGTDEVTVTVPQGSGVRAVAETLVQEKVVADEGTFLDAFSQSGISLQPGEFVFRREMSSASAIDVLRTAGDEKMIYIALSAGLRVEESLDEIAKASGVDRKEFEALGKKPAQFGLPDEAKTLEGYLAPGEYRLPVGSTAKEIVTELVNTTLEELKAAGVTDAEKQYEILTIASIVQAEAGQADYAKVAGAVSNRLKPNDETRGFIQSDATVTYGLDRKSYHITPEEKDDASNLYNTYKHTGLPPGPIGSPGQKAIEAAAKPDSNDYLFWVTVDLDTGETKFAKTYAEHQGYVAEYDAWCSTNAGRCQ